MIFGGEAFVDLIGEISLMKDLTATMDITMQEMEEEALAESAEQKLNIHDEQAKAAGGESSAASAKAAEAAAILEKAIREAADLDEAIGGPIAELLVPSAGSPRWLSKPPSDNTWTRVCDVVESHRKARTTIFFTNSKDELESYLSRVCPR